MESLACWCPKPRGPVHLDRAGAPPVALLGGSHSLATWGKLAGWTTPPRCGPGTGHPGPASPPGT
ncbi:MAG: hypothetical protein ACREBE_29425, partial [bacterium]